jgi:hypothetical protein
MEPIALNMIGLVASLVAIVASIVSKYVFEIQSIRKRTLKIKIGGHSIEIESNNSRDIERALEEVRKLGRERPSDQEVLPSPGAKQ